ncbi:MAG: exosortase system-associated protein, TIGR04073 family [Candidatus Omnitrophica bacterium]|nr:exosortase system-associated protein, TIGR04073 family [Candidatus Omnitrophota bacterium]
MKRKVLCLGFIAMFLSMGICAYAADKPAAKTAAPAAKEDKPLVDTADMRYQKSPLNKLGRGFLNVVTSPEEIPAGIFRVSRDKGDFVGVTLGSVEGFCTFLIRGVVGIYDTVTFVVPPYDKPVMQPEYASESLNDSFHDYQGGSFN